MRMGSPSFDYPGALAEPSSFLQLLLFQEGGGRETEPELRRECRGGWSTERSDRDLDRDLVEHRLGCLGVTPFPSPAAA